MNVMDLTISIVSYNTRDILKNCLSSIYKDPIDLSFEVIVVDNASSDGSADMVAADFPQVHLIRNPTNRLFSKANNQSLRLAGGEFFALINPDTVVSANALKRMVEFMRQHPETGMVGPKIYNDHGQWQPSYARTNTWLWGLAEFLLINAVFCQNRLFWHKYYEGRNLEMPGPHEVDYVTAACLLLRRSLLDKFGGMDENYEMYYEEPDLGELIRKEGFKVMYWPAVSVVHLVGQSTRKMPVLQVHRWAWNSQLYFYKKHYSIYTYVLFRSLSIFTWPLFVLTWHIRRLLGLKNRFNYSRVTSRLSNPRVTPPNLNTPY